MANTTTVAEHRVRIEIPARAGEATEPEKQLNHFVQFVAAVERLGNALGTLAFTWATVILLGGYPTELKQYDFCLATAIVFLEAARMFTTTNRPDYQLFFRTRGAFRILGWKAIILVVCFMDVVTIRNIHVRIEGTGEYITYLLAILAILAAGPFIGTEAARLLINNRIRSAISLWSPMVAIILLGPNIPYYIEHDIIEEGDMEVHRLSFKNSIARWTAYMVLFVVVLLLTVSKLRFQNITELLNCAMGSKLVLWRRHILNMCMFTAMVMLAFTIHGIPFGVGIFLVEICALVVVSFGNLQIPAAVVRVVLPLICFIPHISYSGEGTKNLAPSLYIFYGMVLGQGVLYFAACMLEAFSSVLRRSLIHRAGFRGQLGVEYVNLYYSYAFDKCMAGAVLAPKKISLTMFAMDSVKSHLPKIQLYGVQILHSFLKNKTFKTEAISKLTTSTNTIVTLFNMMGWTSEEDKNIRSFAAKVMEELAGSLLVVPIPGAMQLIASLLDTVHPPEKNYPLLDTDIQEANQDTPAQQVGRDEHNSPVLRWCKQMAINCLIPIEDPSEEEPSTDHDLLPVLGMSILDRLASFDPQNCIEISRAEGLVSKMIEFTSNRTEMNDINETHQMLLKGSSLKVLRKLVSTNGKIGVTLRQKISAHPFLLINLASILDDSESSQELRGLIVEIIRNLAMDGNTREEIGHIRVIIGRLMHTFLSRDAPPSTDSDHLLRRIAGQALAMLATDSVNNCLFMLVEPGYVLIKELAVMINGDRHSYAAANLLRNMCKHARPELTNSDLKELSYILPQVLERIMHAEGAELEALVGLSSEICNVMHEAFIQELEHSQIKEGFIRRLVNALNANIIPTAHSLGIRRVIVEHVIYMIECNSRYANCFSESRMMEALLMVERTPTRAENYRFFLGDAGIMEHSIPMSSLVARAKELMAHES